MKRSFSQSLVVAMIQLVCVSSSFAAWIHDAAISGDSGKIIRILDISPHSVNELDDKYGYSPLHFAAFHGHTATIQALIAHGANIKGTNRDNNTPLQVAQNLGHTSAVEALQPAAVAQTHINEALRWTKLGKHALARRSYTWARDAHLSAGNPHEARLSQNAAILSKSLAGCVTKGSEDTAIEEIGATAESPNGYGRFVYTESTLIYRFKESVISSLHKPSILEVGPGYGDNLADLIDQDKVGEVVLLELGSEQVKILKQKFRFCPNVTVLQMKFPLDILDNENFASTPAGKLFNHKRFDKILVSHVYHYLTQEERVRATQEIKRLLNPKGKAYIQGLTFLTGMFGEMMSHVIQNKDKDFNEWVEKNHVNVSTTFHVMNWWFWWNAKEKESKLLREDHAYVDSKTLQESSSPDRADVDLKHVKVNEAIIKARKRVFIEVDQVAFRLYRDFVKTGQILPDLNRPFLSCATYPVFRSELIDLATETGFTIDWEGSGFLSYLDEKPIDPTREFDYASLMHLVIGIELLNSDPIAAF